MATINGKDYNTHKILITLKIRIMETLKSRYRDLEHEVLIKLSDKVEASIEESVHFNGKCIKIDISNYTELAIVNDSLTLLDEDGLLYDVCTLDNWLDSLIDLLEPRY